MQEQAQLHCFGIFPVRVCVVCSCSVRIGKTKTKTLHQHKTRGKIQIQLGSGNCWLSELVVEGTESWNGQPGRYSSVGMVPSSSLIIQSSTWSPEKEKDDGKREKKNKKTGAHGRQGRPKPVNHNHRCCGPFVLFVALNAFGFRRFSGLRVFSFSANHLL
jgi:hypothetical protein